MSRLKKHAHPWNGAPRLDDVIAQLVKIRDEHGGDLPVFRIYASENCCHMEVLGFPIFVPHVDSVEEVKNAFYSNTASHIIFCSPDGFMHWQNQMLKDFEKQQRFELPFGECVYEDMI